MIAWPTKFTLVGLAVLVSVSCGVAKKFVTVQIMFAPSAVAAALSVNTLPDNARLPPVPMPVHVTLVRVQPTGKVSVIAVLVLAAVKVFAVPAVPGDPAAVVVIESEPKPLVPEKLNVPVLPLEILINCRRGKLVLVNTQVKSEPTTTLALGIVRVVPLKVPMEPVFPVIALLASVQTALTTLKPTARPSVKVTAVPREFTLMADGAAGVAVGSTVVILPGVLAKLVCPNVNVPVPADVIF